MKITNKFLSLILTLCFIFPAGVTVFAQDSAQYPAEGIVWDFCSSDAIATANSAVATATCGKITVDTSFVNSYDVSATFTTNTTRRMQIKLPNNVIQQKNSDGDYIYNYLHILVGNPQDTPVTFGCGINTTSQNTQVTLPANSWTVASFYIEDLFLAGNSNYKRDGKNYGESVQGVAFQMSDQVAGANTTNAGIKYNLDKIWVTADPLPEFKVTSVTPAENYNQMTTVDTVFAFEFSRNLKSGDPQIITSAVKSNDGDTCDATISVLGNKLIVTVADTLEPGKNYIFNSGDIAIKDVYGTLYPNPITYSFTTSSAQVQVSGIIAKNTYDEAVNSIPQSGNVNLSANAINYSFSDASAVIVANVIDMQSGIANCVYASSAELPAQMSEKASISSLNVTVPDGSYIVASVVNNLTDCYPISSSFIILTNSEKTSKIVYASGNISDDVLVTLNEPLLSLDTLTISGQVLGCPDDIVNIVVKQKSASVPQIVMPLCASDGAFTYDYIFDGTGSGSYEVIAVAGGALIPSCKQVIYLGATTKEEIRATFDSPSVTTASALSLLQIYRDGMGIPSDYTTKDLTHIAATLCEQKPYATYPELVEIMNNATFALNTLNSSSWSGYKDVFANYTIILNNDPSLDEYNEYGDSAKAEIHKLAVQNSPFSNFASVRNAIANATYQYTKKLQEQNQNNRPNSSFGGSASGGSVTVGGMSGGGSSSSNLKAESQKPVADTPSGKAEFTDVTKSHWAYDAINELTTRNIISGYEDGTFGGEKAVTRSEFVKLLTGSFNFAEGRGRTFKDVPEDAWYASFLERASAAAVVNGTDGLFMPDAPITRQDAVVMLYRSLVYKNAQLTGSKDFTDSLSVSDYALDAVSAMGASGLILGYQDGSFMPTQNITRYETAKLIYNVIRFIAGGVSE